MREVIPFQLWLGNAMDARDLRRIHEVGIVAVVDLAFEETVPQLTRETIYCRFPLNDGSGNSQLVLSAAIETTVSFIRKDVSTLVVCGTGMSRSPAIVAAALSIIRDQSPDESLQQIIENSPHDVSPTLWSDVKEAFNALMASQKRQQHND